MGWEVDRAFCFERRKGGGVGQIGDWCISAVGSQGLGRMSQN
jgi:hypothetical protein